MPTIVRDLSCHAFTLSYSPGGPRLRGMFSELAQAKAKGPRRSELVGFPLRLAIGEKSLAKGEVEIKPRAGQILAVKAEDAVAKLLELIEAGMPKV